MGTLPLITSYIVRVLQFNLAGVVGKLLDYFPYHRLITLDNTDFSFCGHNPYDSACTLTFPLKALSSILRYISSRMQTWDCYSYCNKQSNNRSAYCLYCPQCHLIIFPFPPRQNFQEKYKASPGYGCAYKQNGNKQDNNLAKQSFSIISPQICIRHPKQF